MRKPYAVAPFECLILGGADCSAGQFRIDGNLAEHPFGRRRNVVDHLSHPHREAIGELQLGLRANHRLLHDVRIPSGRHHGVVGVAIRIDEDAVARHLDIVENHERILLVEAAGEWMVEKFFFVAQLSRQRNFSPGVPIGMQNERPYASAPSGNGIAG